MAHFARLDENNIVTEVIVVNNDVLDLNNEEQSGIAFCESLFDGTWKQTSYNGTFRKNYAGVGYSYDLNRDAFIAPKPFDSWVLNEDSCIWEAPVAKPTSLGYWQWDEETQQWLD
jgi:hypothetical protein